MVNIPDEVYLSAIDYEGLERPEDPEQAKLSYDCDIDQRGWTESGLEKAISDYFLRDGSFADGYEFEECDGWMGS